MRRRNKTYTMQTAINTLPQKQGTNTEAEKYVPSALEATVSTSVSIGIITGTFSYVFGFEVSGTLMVALVPWAVYGIGKFIFLILILIDDIRMVWPTRNIETDLVEGGLLPIIKEMD